VLGRGCAKWLIALLVWSITERAADAEDSCAAMFARTSPALTAGSCDLAAAERDFDDLLPASCQRDAAAGAAGASLERLRAIARAANDEPSACPAVRVELATYALCTLHVAGDEPRLRESLTYINAAQLSRPGQLALAARCLDGLTAIGDERALAAVGEFARGLLVTADVAAVERLAARVSEGTLEYFGPALHAANQSRLRRRDRLYARLCVQHRPQSATLGATCTEAGPQLEVTWDYEAKLAAARALHHERTVQGWMTALTLGSAALHLGLTVGLRAQTASQILDMFGGGAAGAMLVYDGFRLADSSSRWTVLWMMLAVPAGAIVGAVASYFAAGTENGRVATSAVTTAITVASSLAAIWTPR
jgi:hypothetical protein